MLSSIDRDLICFYLAGFYLSTNQHIFAEVYMVLQLTRAVLYLLHLFAKKHFIYS